MQPYTTHLKFKNLLNNHNMHVQTFKTLGDFSGTPGCRWRCCFSLWLWSYRCGKVQNSSEKDVFLGQKMFDVRHSLGQWFDLLFLFMWFQRCAYTSLGGLSRMDTHWVLGKPTPVSYLSRHQHPVCYSNPLMRIRIWTFLLNRRFVDLSCVANT